MRRVSLLAPSFAYDPEDPEGFRSGMFRFGGDLGASKLGATLYDLPPDQAVCPYHYEHGEEEWLLVVEGRPSVRHPGGTDVLEPMDVVCFPVGPEGAHAVRNDTDEPVRVLLWSDVVLPTVTTYPDSDKVGVYTGRSDDDLMVRRSSRVPYFDGEA